MGILKTPSEIEIMTEAGRRLASVLSRLQAEVRPGISTRYLDERSRALIKESGCRPAFLGYKPHGAAKAYPATLCASVNDTVVHGLPSGYVIQEGDLVKLDLGLIHKGFYSDAAVTVGVGNISPIAKDLIRTTREALTRGIAEAWSGKTLGDIGWAIEKYVTARKFSIVETLSGHGIGTELHEEPYVLNVGRPHEGDILEVGMVLAIEPMVAVGSGRVKCIKDDSYVTMDGSIAAHFEHTIAITKEGPKILTQ
ncbi:MAG: type I methionyl aminopeptidase [Patescibacteria group bacterium]